MSQSGPEQSIRGPARCYRKFAASVALAVAVTPGAAEPVGHPLDWLCAGGELPPYEVRCEPRHSGPISAAVEHPPGIRPAMIPVAERRQFDPDRGGAWLVPLFAPPRDRNLAQRLLENVLCGAREDCAVAYVASAARLTSLP